MRTRWWLILLSLLGGATHAADFVFVNGGVYTVDDDRSWADSVAVDSGQIVYIGDRTGAEAFIDSDTEVVDLKGRMLLPGFHDSHSHPMVAGTRFLRCDFEGLAWPNAVLARVRQCANDLESGAWLRGIGLGSEVFDDPGALEQIDEASGDHPVYIDGADFQGHWVNSLALAAAGIGDDTPDPVAGVIERGPDGRATGVLRGEAVGRVYALLPTPDTDDLRRALRWASSKANALGITSVNEAKLWPPHWEAYVAADRAGELTLRVQGSLALAPGITLEDLVRRRDHHASSRFRADAAKLALDGSSLLGAAAVLEPFTGNDAGRGILNLEAEVVTDWVMRLDRAGFQVHLHALGDRAVRLGLDAIEAAIQANGPLDRRHHMAHLSLIHPDDLGRFRSLDVTADVQPLWAYRRKGYVDEASALGPERSRRLNAFASLFDSGARVVAGSDWISESMNPLYGIQIAVTRRPPDGSGPALEPDQRVSLARMIDAYTRNGAWLARQEHLTGTIEVGKAADLIVLEKNLFEIDPMTLVGVRVLLTLLDGQVVYRDGPQEPSGSATSVSQRGSSATASMP